MDDTMVQVRFDDGREVMVPERIKDDVVGLDEDGDVVVTDMSMMSDDGVRYDYSLTPCCFGSGKGSVNSDTGICCRGCYAEVDPKFGGTAFVVTEVVR